MNQEYLDKIKQQALGTETFFSDEEIVAAINGARESAHYSEMVRDMAMLYGQSISQEKIKQAYAQLYAQRAQQMSDIIGRGLVGSPLEIIPFDNKDFSGGISEQGSWVCGCCARLLENKKTACPECGESDAKWAPDPTKAKSEKITPQGMDRWQIISITAIGALVALNIILTLACRLVDRRADAKLADAPKAKPVIVHGIYTPHDYQAQGLRIIPGQRTDIQTRDGIISIASDGDGRVSVMRHE